MINEHNAKEGETYTMAENKFTDISAEEFKAIFLGYKPIEGETLAENVHTDESFVGDVNWVTKGMVQAVKD